MTQGFDTSLVCCSNSGCRTTDLAPIGSGPFIGLNIHIPWETTNVARPRTKRAAVVAITNCIASVSHWFTPYFFVGLYSTRVRNVN
jgi:hypothetical protein